MWSVPNNASMPYVALVGRGHGPSQQPWARVGPTQINFHLPVPSAVHIGASTSALADDGEEQQYFGVTRHGWRRKAAPSNGEDYWDGLRRAKSGGRGKARRRAGAGRGKEEPVPGVLLAAAKITPKQGTKQSMAGIRYEHWQLWDGSKPAFVWHCNHLQLLIEVFVLMICPFADCFVKTVPKASVGPGTAILSTFPIPLSFYRRKIFSQIHSIATKREEISAGGDGNGE